MLCNPTSSQVVYIAFFFLTGTEVFHSLIEKLQKAETVKGILEEDPSSEVYWAIINGYN